jgi:hypothetical protein
MGYKADDTILADDHGVRLSIFIIASGAKTDTKGRFFFKARPPL